MADLTSVTRAPKNEIPVPFDTVNDELNLVIDTDNTLWAKDKNSILYPLSQSGVSPFANILKQSFTTGENISSNKAVVLINGLLFNFNILNPFHYNKCIGVSNQNGLTSEIIDVILKGVQDSFSPSLIQGDTYYAGLMGSITNTPTTIGIYQKIGIALNTNDLLIDLGTPINLI